MTYDKSPFRATPWPEMPLPHPGSLGGIPYRYDGAADALLPDWDIVPDGLRDPAPTTETDLKLAALDQNDTAAIVDFATTHGQLDLRGDHQLYDLADGAFALRSGYSDPELDAAYDKRSTRWATERSPTLSPSRWAILYMRDLIAARRALDGQLDPATHRWEAPFWRGMDELDAPPWTPDSPAATLSLALNVGLTPLSPQLHLFRSSEVEHTLGGPDFSTWTLCCLELFNHIVEAAAYKTCANETCGRLFVRQEGRAVYGQSRGKGVKYCSAGCARAQTQRHYRRKKRLNA